MPKLPDYPWGLTPEQAAAYEEEIKPHWGEGALAELFFGPLADIPGFRDFYGRFQRTSASPMMALMLWKALSNIDVRPILNAVRVPTLILGRQGDLVAPLDAAKELADGIPDAQFRELPPGPHGLVDDAMAEAILDFVCGEHTVGTNERVLSTVFFTDIVSSTELLSAQGDARWRHELDAHDWLVDRLLGKYGGRRVKHTGDGVFALFEGPTKAARCGWSWYPHSRRAESASGVASTPVNANDAERSGAAWPSTSALESVRWRGLTRCSRVAQSAISQRARDCASKAWAHITSRACPKRSISTGSLHQRAA